MTNLMIAANNLRFDKRLMTAPASTEVTLRFENKERGVLHNVAIYTSRSAQERIFGSDTFAGVETKEYRFRTPGPGDYFFRCDVHPDTMTGTFAVK